MCSSSRVERSILREVEDVVDHLEQVLRGLRRKCGVLSLFFRHVGGFQQLQHP
jgi:hypothetical protein